ncbi:hypothetical protein DFJ73DRAFT_758094 [Zopfochytrium polystomum]|nr:hypothetical protein DFJ73DRAFT_758094 [Zopfochytrium polystomum]
MTYESVLKYSEESIRQSKELASFLRKRQALEVEYARSLRKLAQSYQKPNIPPSSSFYRSSPSSSLSGLNSSGPMDKADAYRSQLLKTSLWRAFAEIIDGTSKIASIHAFGGTFSLIPVSCVLQSEMAQCLLQDIIEPFLANIRDMEAVRKLQMEKGADLSKNLHDAHSGLRKVRKEYSSLQALANEALAAHQKAQLNASTKDRDMEKLTTRMNTAVEKAKRAEETLKICEEICNIADADFYLTLRPGLFEEIRQEEEDRYVSTRRVIIDYIYLEKLRAVSLGGMIDELGSSARGIDMAVDLDEYFELHVAEERRTNVEVPPKLFVEASHSGWLKLKKGNSTSDWKSYFFVIGTDKKLYCCQSEEATVAKEVIPLLESSISLVDSSLVNSENCFQVISFDSNTGRQFFYFAAESPKARDSWFQQIREVCYCCAKCAQEFRYSPDSEANEALQDDDSYRLVRTLDVTVSEAKDLHGATRANYYCVIQLDDVKHARTATKVGDAPFWGESFSFQDIRPHYSDLRVSVFSYNRIQRDAYIGSVNINLDALENHVKTEDWHSIKQQARISFEPVSVGSMRLSVLVAVRRRGRAMVSLIHLQRDFLLPFAKYKDFIDSLTKPPYYAIVALGNCSGVQKEVLAKTFLKILLSQGCEVDAMKALLEREISETENVNIIFRGNSLATKLMDQYMKVVGMDYLHETIASTVRSLCAIPDSLEVDPSKISNPETLKNHWRLLLSHTRTLLTRIFDSKDNCPQGILEIFKHIQSVVVRRSQDAVAVSQLQDEGRYAVISGFIFLRFFCPAILSPNLFGILSDFPSPSTARNLTLIAKIVQNLANLSDFGSKEPFMKECNPFIMEQIPNMRLFIDYISSQPVLTTGHAVNEPVSNARREAEVLVQMFDRNMAELERRPQADLTDMFAILKVLEGEHRTFRRLREKEDSAQREKLATTPAFSTIPTAPFVKSTNSSPARTGPSDPKPSSSSLSNSLPAPSISFRMLETEESLSPKMKAGSMVAADPPKLNISLLSEATSLSISEQSSSKVQDGRPATETGSVPSAASPGHDVPRGSSGGSDVIVPPPLANATSPIRAKYCWTKFANSRKPPLQFSVVLQKSRQSSEGSISSGAALGSVPSFRLRIPPQRQTASTASGVGGAGHTISGATGVSGSSGWERSSSGNSLGSGASAGLAALTDLGRSQRKPSSSMFRTFGAPPPAVGRSTSPAIGSGNLPLPQALSPSSSPHGSAVSNGSQPDLMDIRIESPDLWKSLGANDHLFNPYSHSSDAPPLPQLAIPTSTVASSTGSILLEDSADGERTFDDASSIKSTDSVRSEGSARHVDNLFRVSQSMIGGNASAGSTGSAGSSNASMTRMSVIAGRFKNRFSQLLHGFDKQH